MRVPNPIQAAARLDNWEASGMLSLGTPRTFGQGEVLFRQGPGAANAALITRGLVRVAADDVSLAILGDGDLIGEEAAILSGPPMAGNRVTVVSLRKCCEMAFVSMSG
jgi:CRP-like cAMP-binding protein